MRLIETLGRFGCCLVNIEYVFCAFDGVNFLTTANLANLKLC